MDIGDQKRVIIVEKEALVETPLPTFPPRTHTPAGSAGDNEAGKAVS